MDFNIQLEASKQSVDNAAYEVLFLALSKNNTHKRQDYYLTVDLESANWQAQTLYLDHDLTFENAIGKVTEVYKNPEGFYVKVKFFKEISQSAQAFKRFAMGLNECVSVGLSSASEPEVLEELEGCPHLLIKNASIYELSAVYQGADSNAKALAVFSKHSPEANKATEANQPSESQRAELVAVIDDAINKINQYQGELMSSKEIMQLAKQFNAYELANEYIQAEKSASEFKDALLANQQSTINILNSKSHQPSAPAAFSLGALAKVRSGMLHFSDLAFEAPRANNFILPKSYGAEFAAANVQGYEPTNAANRGTLRRSDLLINQAVEESEFLQKLRIFSDLNSEVEIPRNLSTLKAEFVNYGVAQDGQKLSFDTVKIKPTTARVSVRITQQMLKMSDLELDNIIFTAAKNAFTKSIEEALLNPQGDTPENVKLNFTGAVPAPATFATAPKFEDVIELERLLYESNFIAAANANLLVNSKLLTKLRTTQREEGTGIYLAEGRDLQGINIIQSRYLPENQIIYGDFSNIALGFFENLRVNVMNQEAGVILFEFFSDFGAAVLDASAFVK